MNDKETKKALNEIFMEIADKVFERNMRFLCDEYVKYGECFQHLYKPGEMPPKRFGYSGEEI